VRFAKAKHVPRDASREAATLLDREPSALQLGWTTVEKLGDRERDDQPRERARSSPVREAPRDCPQLPDTVTGVGSGSPRTPASKFAAAIAAIFPRVVRDADAM
jgi:hypothetical protein